MKLNSDQRFAQDVQPQLEDLIDLIDSIHLKADRPEMGGQLIPVSQFNHCVLMDDSLRSITHDDSVWVGPEVFDLWPLRARIIRPCGDEGELAILNSLRSVRPKDVRGRVKRLSPRMIQLSRAHVWRNGRGTTTSMYFAVRSDGGLENITNPPRAGARTLAVSPDVQLLVRCLAGISLWLEYSWTVEVGAVDRNGLKIRVPTSPAGARKLLSLRDVPAGRERRRALRHWVSSHTRILQREDAEMEVDVREHLRGATPFRWDDLEGVVRPSAYDLRRNGG